MREPTDQILLDIARRRPLTPTEQQHLDAWLAEHPEDRERWRTEVGLTRLLQGLPDVPLSSNFTARVLAAADRCEAAGALRVSAVEALLARWLRRWQPAAAMAVVLLLVGTHLVQSHRRGEMARSVAALPAAELANVEVWQDFDVINRLPSGPLPSVEELAEAMR